MKKMPIVQMNKPPTVIPYFITIDKIFVTTYSIFIII